MLVMISELHHVTPYVLLTLSPQTFQPCIRGLWEVSLYKVGENRQGIVARSRMGEDAWCSKSACLPAAPSTQGVLKYALREH